MLSVLQALRVWENQVVSIWGDSAVTPGASELEESQTRGESVPMDKWGRQGERMVLQVSGTAEALVTGLHHD